MNAFNDRIYRGPVFEKGGTALQSCSPSPAIRYLYSRGFLSGSILDYGAGKFGRNAIYLRNQGMTVYAYDPHHGGPEIDGWNGVSRIPPDSSMRFDVGFTSFVLNVVPEYVEDEILNRVSEISATPIHITRNHDITDMVYRALKNPYSIVSSFFQENYATAEEAFLHQRGMLTRNDAEAFARFGTVTTRGFQRLPGLEHKGWNLLHEQSGWKVYHQVK